MLENLSIGLVISLTEKKLPDIFSDTNVRNVHIPIENHHSPTLEQIHEFIYITQRTIAQGKKVVVHCLGGLGRTETMLACWLIASKKINALEAIGIIRQHKSHAIDSEQEQCIHEFYGTVLEDKLMVMDI